MEIKKYYLKNNRCYTNPTIIYPIGFMLHSTGANNPNLRRYIQPDDGHIGVNTNKNDWNNQNIRLMVHGFIGKDKNGNVKAYQTLPYNYRAWHCGGSGNSTHVSWEICEDELNDKEYFTQVYNLSVYVASQFCISMNYDEKCIIDHAEGHRRGIASNHGDVAHWFSRFGKSMSTFRADVRNMIDKIKNGAVEDTSNNTSKEQEGDVMTKSEIKQIVIETFEEIMNTMKNMPNSEWANRTQVWGVQNKISDGTRPRMYLERQEGIAMINNYHNLISESITDKVVDEVVKRLKAE